MLVFPATLCLFLPTNLLIQLIVLNSDIKRLVVISLGIKLFIREMKKLSKRNRNNTQIVLIRRCRRGTIN